MRTGTALCDSAGIHSAAGREGGVRDAVPSTLNKLMMHIK